MGLVLAPPLHEFVPETCPRKLLHTAARFAFEQYDGSLQTSRIDPALCVRVSTGREQRPSHVPRRSTRGISRVFTRIRESVSPSPALTRLTEASRGVVCCVQLVALERKRPAGPWRDFFSSAAFGDRDDAAPMRLSRGEQGTAGSTYLFDWVTGDEQVDPNPPPASVAAAAPAWKTALHPTDSGRTSTTQADARRAGDAAAAAGEGAAESRGEAGGAEAAAEGVAEAAAEGGASAEGDSAESRVRESLGRAPLVSRRAGLTRKPPSASPASSGSSLFKRSAGSSLAAAAAAKVTAAKRDRAAAAAVAAGGAGRMAWLWMLISSPWRLLQFMLVSPKPVVRCVQVHVSPVCTLSECEPAHMWQPRVATLRSRLSRVPPLQHPALSHSLEIRPARG